MKKNVVLVVLVLTLVQPSLLANTFFLYIEESCNGERGLFLTGAREGILDTFFENDQIIYDDMEDKGRGDRLETQDIDNPLSTARRGGADFLLAVAIQSHVEKSSPEPKSPENIRSSCAYYLYEVGTGRLLTKGSYRMEKTGLAEKKERDEMGFELGRTISRGLSGFFTP